MKKNWLYYIIPLLIIVAGWFVMSFLINSREKPAKREPAVRQIVVSTVVVNLAPVKAQITAFGRVSSAQPVQLISDVTGELLTGDIQFVPGQSFKRGDLLIRIDDRQTQLQIKSKKSELLNALAQVLPEIKVTFSSDYKVWEDYFSKCSFDSALLELPKTNNDRIRLYLARFNVYQLYFAIKELEIKLEKHYHYAAFDGSIITADMRVGSHARLGAVLGRIVNLEDLEVEVSVAVEDAVWIDHLSKVKFSSRELPGVWQGGISRIASEIDTKTQSLPVFVTLDKLNDHSIPNGSFLTAELPGRTIENAILVPREAIYEERYVYVIVDGQLMQRDITIARTLPDHVIITDGLKQGDTLVTEQLQGVIPGMKAVSKSSVGKG